MDKDFEDVYRSGNKLVTFIIIFIVLALIAFGYFFVYSKYKFTLKTINHEIGTPLSSDINDYIRKKLVDTAGYKLDLSKVKTDEIGTYEYKIKYNKITKKGIIKIVDTIPPEFIVKEKVEVEMEDTNFYPSDMLESCVDASMPCFVSFKNDDDENKLNIPGEYTINIIVEDLYKNKKEASVNIKVYEKGALVKEEEKDLLFATSSSNLPGFTDEYYTKFTKAIQDNTDKLEDEIASIAIDTIENYVNTNYPGYKLNNTEIVKMYNKSNYVIGLVIKITINNGTDRIVYMRK